MHHLPWTDDEVAILREYYNKVPKETLLELLPNRTWKAIVAKAKSLKLYRYKSSPRWSYPTNYKPIPLRLTPEQKGYVAAMIDGEGSILMLSSKGGTRYNPVIVIANTDKKLITYLHNLLGLGHIYVSKPKGKRRRQYILKIGTHLEIFSLLKEVGGYLISKKQLASLMVKYCKSRLDRGVKPGRNIIYSKEEIEIAERIRALNELSHRGDWKKKIKRHVKPIWVVEN